jgi:glycosyltransferase GtfC/desvancosaminyl-vancomycin vancosaminetransferase/vancomycin aglycone glucosyltransferase
MRVLLSVSGSRGDVEPVVAFAVRLRALGVEVRVCASPDYAERLAEVGVPLVPVGPKLRMRSHNGPRPSPERVRRFVAEAIATQFDQVPAAAQGCDAVVAAGDLVAAVAVRSVAEKLGIPYFYAVGSQPYLPAPHYPPPVDEPTPPDVTDNGTLWAQRSQRFCERFGDQVNSHRVAIGLPPVENIFDYGHGDRPWLVADPVLAPLRTDLDAVQTGAWILPDERPLSAELEAFLAAGPPPVYVGFGSTSGVGTGDAARMAIEAIRAHGHRVILSRGWADVAPPDDRDDCFVVSEANFQVLFGRVAAVVHHGGAGTTHVAARAGVPQIVVPDDTDQPYFASRVAELGIGVAHEVSAPTVESLSAALVTALGQDIRARAATVAGMVRTDGTTVAAELLFDAASWKKSAVSA